MAILCVRLQEMDKTFPENSTMSVKVISRFLKYFEIELTVALLFGTWVPKRSISSISSRVGMVFKNCPQRLPLKSQSASFGAIKFFRDKFFIGSLAGSGPEITIMVNAGRVFRPDSTYMTCFWWSVVSEISVTRVLALKCQTKVRASSRKKSATVKIH